MEEGRGEQNAVSPPLSEKQTVTFLIFVGSAKFKSEGLSALLSSFRVPLLT